MATLKGHAKVQDVVGGYHDEINKIDQQIQQLTKKKAELVLGAKHDLRAAGFTDADIEAVHASHKQ